MVYRVVATKLTEDEHTKLLDACNTEGCSPSSFIKNAIIEKIGINKKKDITKLTVNELNKLLNEN